MSDIHRGSDGDILAALISSDPAAPTAQSTASAVFMSGASQPPAGLSAPLVAYSDSNDGGSDEHVTVIAQPNPIAQENSTATPRKRHFQSPITRFLTIFGKAHPFAHTDALRLRKRDALRFARTFDDDLDSGVDSDFHGEGDYDSLYSFESDVNHTPVGYWERDGALLFRKESSFMDGRYTSGRGAHGRLNYDGLKPRELKPMASNRLLKDPYPQGVTLKYYYLRLLHRADKEWRFRFMDLPPEMRMMTCRYLLLFGSPNRVAGRVPGKTYPAILQTCQQIYQEAHSILYDENTFTVGLEAGSGPEGDGKPLVGNVHKQFRSSMCHHAPWLRLPKGIEDFPEFFRRVSRLQINLGFWPIHTVTLSENATWPLNHLLYSLASFLMDGHRLKTLRLRLNISSVMDDSKYGMILYPLRRLRNIRHVIIEGNIPGNIKAKLVKDLKSSEPAFNTLRHWQLIDEELRAQLSVHMAMHDEIECLCGECPTPDCLGEISFHIDHLESISVDSCFSSRLEENFMAHLAIVRKFIGRVKVSELKELVQALIRKRKDLTNYEAVSDDGRLEEASKIWVGKGHVYDLKYDPEDDWSEAFDGTGIEKRDEDTRTEASQATKSEQVVHDSEAGAGGATGSFYGAPMPPDASDQIEDFTSDLL